MHRSVFAPGLFLVLPLVSVLAAEPTSPFLARGSNELSLRLSPDFAAPNGDNLEVEIGYGRFIYDRLLISGRVDYHVMEDIVPDPGSDDGNDYRAWELGVDATYHFTVGPKLFPYLGVGAGWRRINANRVESGLVYGPTAGLKYAVAEQWAVNLWLRYQLATDDVFINDWESEDHDLTYGLGLIVHF